MSSERKKKLSGSFFFLSDADDLGDQSAGVRVEVESVQFDRQPLREHSTKTMMLFLGRKLDNVKRRRSRSLDREDSEWRRVSDRRVNVRVRVQDVEDER